MAASHLIDTGMYTKAPTGAGIGLRSAHYGEISETLPPIRWLEAHSENYFGQGGQALAYLETIRSHYPLSLHGVGLSLGSTDPLNRAHLQKLKTLSQRFEPWQISEHLCWCSVDGRYFNDLLPLPYTEEAMRHISGRIVQVQEYLGRQILVENVSSYLQFTSTDIPEWEFVREVASRAGCGILLDVNNVYVSASNHGFDGAKYLDAIPVDAVQEMHLAGYDRNGEILLDTHGKPVHEEVWRLYRHAVRRFGCVPTLVEWDTDIPDLNVLMAEADKAQLIMDATNALVA